jgi:anti-sigma factor RsiW
MDIEKYITGNLTEAERREMEAAMAADPALRVEVETRRHLQMGLQELYLQNKVQQVAQARRNWLRRQWWLRIGGVILLMALLSVAVFFIWKKPSGVESDSKTTTPELQQQSPEENKDDQPQPTLNATSLLPKGLACQVN